MAISPSPQVGEGAARLGARGWGWMWGWMWGQKKAGAPAGLKI